MLNNKTDIITQDHPFASHIVVVDENDNVINKIISYNNKTKEAEVYAVDEKGKVKTEPIAEGKGYLLPKFKGDVCGFKLVTEKKVLKGSRIMFKY